MAIIKSQIEKAKTPKDKEYWIKFLGLGSPYAAVYIAAGKKISFSLFVIEKNEEFPVLYIDKHFPQEYIRLKNLPAIKKGFKSNLKEIGNRILREIKVMTISQGGVEKSIPKRPPYNTFSEIKYMVDLTGQGAFSWGNTALRSQLISAKITKFKNNTYRLNVKYNNWMYDKFTDPLDGSKIGKPFDLPKSIPYVMKTKKERKEVTILIKNLNEIPERLSRQSK